MPRSAPAASLDKSMLYGLPRPPEAKTVHCPACRDHCVEKSIVPTDDTISYPAVMDVAKPLLSDTV